MADPHSHERKPLRPVVAPETPIDAGSQALSEALRSSFVVVKVVMVLLVFVFLGSGFFTVGPQERAIILRLGKPVGEGERALLMPGLHWSFPYPIDEYVKVSISGLQNTVSTVGWFATTPEMELAGTEPPAGPSLNPAIDGYVLTGDRNIIHCRVKATYYIEDPVQYVFGFVNASNAVQSVLDSALLHAAARHNVDDILTRDVVGFDETVRRRASELARERELGIVFDQCSVQRTPPRQLKDAFANVLRAEVTRNKVLNDARQYDYQVRTKADAEAKDRVNSAESQRARYVSEISSRAEQFQQLLPKAQENPALFVQQRLADTLGRVMTNATDKIYLGEGGNGGGVGGDRRRELRLLLSPDPPKPKPVEEPGKQR